MAIHIATTRGPVEVKISLLAGDLISYPSIEMARALAMARWKLESGEPKGGTFSTALLCYAQGGYPDLRNPDLAPCRTAEITLSEDDGRVVGSSGGAACALAFFCEVIRRLTAPIAEVFGVAPFPEMVATGVLELQGDRHSVGRVAELGEKAAAADHWLRARGPRAPVHFLFPEGDPDPPRLDGFELHRVATFGEDGADNDLLGLVENWWCDAHEGPVSELLATFGGSWGRTPTSMDPFWKKHLLLPGATVLAIDATADAVARRAWQQRAAALPAEPGSRFDLLLARATAAVLLQRSLVTGAKVIGELPGPTSQDKPEPHVHADTPSELPEPASGQATEPHTDSETTEWPDQQFRLAVVVRAPGLEEDLLLPFSSVPSWDLRRERKGKHEARISIHSETGSGLLVLPRAGTVAAGRKSSDTSFVGSRVVLRLCPALDGEALLATVDPDFTRTDRRMLPLTIDGEEICRGERRLKAGAVILSSSGLTRLEVVRWLEP